MKTTTLLSLISLLCVISTTAMENPNPLIAREQLEKKLTEYHDAYKKEHYIDYMHTFFIRLPGKANAIHIAILQDDVAFLQEVLPAIKSLDMAELLNKCANTQPSENPIGLVIKKRRAPENSAAVHCCTFSEDEGKEADERVAPLLKLLLDNGAKPTSKDLNLSCFCSTNNVFKLLVPKMDKKYLAYVWLNEGLPVPLEFENKPIQLHCDKMDSIKKLLENEDIEKLAEEYIQQEKAKPNPFANLKFTSTPIPVPGGNAELSKEQ